MNRSRLTRFFEICLVCIILFAASPLPGDDTGSTSRNIRLEARNLLRAANTSFGEGNSERALAKIDSILALDSLNPDAFFLQAKISLAGGDTASATEILELARHKAPRSTRIKILLARIFIHRGEYEMPLALTEEILKFKPSDGEASFLHGWGLLIKGDTVQAADAFEKILTDKLAGGKK